MTVSNVAQRIKLNQHPKGLGGFLRYYAPQGVPLVDLVFHLPSGGLVVWEKETGMVRRIGPEEARNKISRTLPR